MEPEISMVTKKIVTTHLICFLLSRLLASGSALAILINTSFSNEILGDGSRQDKSYGLGRVVFHRTEPAVAAQAVSI
jgi:hypothetical protein